jgi:hypothetical protein
MSIRSCLIDPSTALGTADTDLIYTENEIRRLRSEMEDLKTSATVSPLNRKPVQLAADSKIIQYSSAQILDQNAIRKRRRETAVKIGLCLDYATSLVTSASTYAPRRSIADEVRQQTNSDTPAMKRFLEDEESGPSSSATKTKAKAKESTFVSTFLALPRLTGSLLLITAFLVAVMLIIAMVIIWFFAQAITCFQRWAYDSAKMWKDLRSIFNWFEEKWRDIWWV